MDNPDTPRHMRDADQQFAAESPIRGSTRGGTPNPNYEPIFQFFEYAHLPTRLQMISGPFHSLAVSMTARLPRNPERTVMLRKLLEAKDCAGRAELFQ